MSILTNTRREQFAQSIARGMSATRAYASAGIQRLALLQRNGRWGAVRMTLIVVQVALSVMLFPRDLSERCPCRVPCPCQRNV
jgi:hypothetical protein